VSAVVITAAVVVIAGTIAVVEVDLPLVLFLNPLLRGSHVETCSLQRQCVDAVSGAGMAEWRGTDNVGDSSTDKGRYQHRHWVAVALVLRVGRILSCEDAGRGEQDVIESG